MSTRVKNKPSLTGRQPLHDQLGRRTTRYVIISPVGDEEAYVGKTIESILAQTVRPAEWIIVNDGSTDRTGQIIDDYAAKYPWIRAIHRTNRGFSNAGGGVDDPFNEG